MLIGNPLATSQAYSCDWVLMNQCDYYSSKAIKYHLFILGDIHKKARDGNSTAHSIYIDLTDAIRIKGVLTHKQKKYLLMWMDGYTLTDIATIQRLAPHNVHNTISLACVNISKYLQKK